MFDGLWTVEFVSTRNMSGRGVLIINGSRILGGDAGYYYSGTCSITDNKIHATISVIKYDPNSISVFGDISNFELTIDGDIDEYRLDTVGKIVGNPQAQIKVVGTKKEDL